MKSTTEVPQATIRHYPLEGEHGMPTLLILAIIAACLAVVTLLVRRGYVRSINKQETAAEATRTQREADREAASTTGSGSRGYDSDYGRSSYHEPQTTLDLSSQ